ncbi:MAG: hypothetical protein ACU837_06550 [Gammaproteobacteria bacterium]
MFPLADPAKRATNHHADLAEEEPLLLDPTATDPQQFIGFRAEIPYAIGGNVYGDTTIRTLKLDREDLNERRREKLDTHELLLNVIALAENQPHNVELEQLAEKAKNVLAEAVLPGSEYAATAMAKNNSR